MQYRNIAGNPTTLQKLVEDEPEWACSQITRLRAENEALKQEIERLKAKLDASHRVSAAHIEAMKKDMR